MAPDRRLVVHSAEGDPVELAPESPGDAPAERRLADARRADEAQDGALLVALELSDGQILENPPLHLLEPVVVGVEHRADCRHVGAVRALARPREVDNPLEVRSCGPELRRAGRERAQPLQLPVGDFARLLGEARRRDPGGQRIDVALAVRALFLAELALDGLHLLAKQVLALLLSHVALDLRVDAVADLEDLASPDHLGQDEEHPGLDVERSEDLRLLREGHVQAGGDEIGQHAGALDGVNLGPQFFGHTELIHDLADRVPEVEKQGIELHVVGPALLDWSDLDLRHGLAGVDRLQPRPGDTAQDHDDGALASCPRDADHLRDDADLVQVGLGHGAQRLTRLRRCRPSQEDGDRRSGMGAQVLCERRIAKQESASPCPGTRPRRAGRGAANLGSRKEPGGRELWAWSLSGSAHWRTPHADGAAKSPRSQSGSRSRLRRYGDTVSTPRGRASVGLPTIAPPLPPAPARSPPRTPRVQARHPRTRLRPQDRALRRLPWRRPAQHHRPGRPHRPPFASRRERAERPCARPRCAGELVRRRSLQPRGRRQPPPARPRSRSDRRPRARENRPRTSPSDRLRAKRASAIERATRRRRRPRHAGAAGERARSRRCRGQSRSG